PIRLAPRRRGMVSFALIAAGVLAVCGVALRTATVAAQTLGMTPPPTVIDDCGKVRGICCSGPLVWGFDPFGGCQQCDGVNGHSCRSGFTAHRPATWYGGVDMVALTPNASDEVALARVGTTTVNALSTADLRSEYDAGSRLVVGRTFRGCFQLEAVYQGNYAWSDERTVAATSTADASQLTTILNGFASTNRQQIVSAQTASRMTTAEANFRTWLEMPPGALDVQFLVGARYFSTSERLAFQGEPAAGTGESAVATTDNDLYGAQLGLDTRLLLHRLFYVDFEGKVALCENFATVNQTANATLDASNSDQRTSLLGDLMISGNFQFRPNLSLRFGYQAIFVDGLALAANNMPSNTSLIEAGVGQFRNDGVMVYHGPTLGLIGTW
ncbi:MAG: hypothetical protein ACKO38_13460, partial [Planctomycetota bacterium]